MTPPQLFRYYPLWGPNPLVLFSSKEHSSARKDLYTFRDISMWFPRLCETPELLLPLVLHNPPPLWPHVSSRVGSHFRLVHDSDTICNDPTPTMYVLSALGPIPLMALFSPRHTKMGEKASTHWKEITPYKHISMWFPMQCGTLGLLFPLVLHSKSIPEFIEPLPFCK